MVNFVNGFELFEKIFAIDINVKVCFMSSGEINREALREAYPTRHEGCFIRKPVAIACLNGLGRNWTSRAMMSI